MDDLKSAVVESIDDSAADRFEIAEKDDASLGNILLKMGVITEEQLKKAIDIQKRQAPLGRILREMTDARGQPLITREQLEEALMIQKVERGEASAREESALYRTQKKRLVTEVVNGLKETTILSEKLVETLG